MADFEAEEVESPHYDIPIEDLILKKDYGFDKIIFPLNGNGTMILHNSQYSTKTTHVPFDKHTYTVEKTIDVLIDGLLGQGLDLGLVDNITRYVRKKLLELQENPDLDFFKFKNGNGNGKSKQRQQAVAEQEQGVKIKLTWQDIKFVIDTITKEAKCDRLAIIQLFLGMASAFTKTPIHHLVNSKEAGAGKNYLLELVSSYWPEKYTFPLGHMTDKAIFYRKGILVITDPDTGEEKLAQPIIDDLQSQIDMLGDDIDTEKNKEPKDRDKKLIAQNKKKIRNLESQINEIKENAQKISILITKL